MQINGPSQIHGAQPLSGPERTQGPAAEQPTEALHGADQLDISSEADMVSRVRDLPDIRSDKVADIRAQIEAGVYETEDKIEIAVGRLFDELAG